MLSRHLQRFPATLPVFLLAIMLVTGCSQASQTVDDAADNLPGVGEHSFHANLTGAAEVPGPGDPDGRGGADVTIDREDGEVCYEIEVTGVEPISAAHIHTGAAGASGPPVVNFNLAANGMDGCVSGVSAEVLNNIIGNPAGFYVNVHNQPYPAGALRGQLVD